MRHSPSRLENNRRRAERRGHLGEVAAALYLRVKLYRVLARRVKTPVGEIDLVAQKGKTLVFTEVKTRARAEDEAEAHRAVNRRRIVSAANWYLSRHPGFAGLTVRFDLIFLGGLSWPNHIPNAFGPDADW